MNEVDKFYEGGLGWYIPRVTNKINNINKTTTTASK